jgi:hypothetical protein
VEFIFSDAPWDLDHLPGGGQAPSHRRCNRQTMLHNREPPLLVSRECELVAARAANLACGDERRPAPSLGSVRAPYLAHFAAVQLLIAQSASSPTNPTESGGIGLNGEA